MTSANKIVRFLDKFEEFSTQLLLAVIVLLLGIQVFFRNLTSITFAWNEELSRFVFVWFVYIGMCYATRQGSHIRVTAHMMWLPEKVRSRILACTDLIWLAFDVVMIWASVRVIVSMFEFPYISPTLNFSIAYVYMIFPLAFSLNALRTILYNYDKLYKNPKHSVQGDNS